MTYLIIDAAIVAVLVFFFLRGRKKGLILALCGLVAFFVALMGARFVSQQLSPMAADALEPYFSGIIQDRLDRAPDKDPSQLLLPGEDGNSPVTDLLRSLGFYDKVSDMIRDTLSAQAAQTVTDVALALARAVAEMVAGVLVFVLAFLLILALWFVISHALDLAARLPLIHGLNRLLGGVFGLAHAMLLLFLAAWVLRLLGIVLPQDVVMQTTVLRFFITTNPMDLISGI